MYDASPQPNGEKFQVWHRSGERFTPVALVRIGNLLGAVVLTMNSVDAHWQDGDRVTALVPDARSTDAGDVIVSPEGVAYEIKVTPHLGLVFDPIDFPPYRELMALYAEWRADQAAATARDLREQYREFLGAASTQQEPSRAANDNDQDRDGGIER